MKQAIVGFAGSAVVALAVYVTGSAIPLWALFFVAVMVGECKEDTDKKEEE